MKQQPQSFLQDSSCVVEYELSRYFMNYARDNLFKKEIKLMIQSDELLDTLGKDRRLKSICSLDKDEESFYVSRTLDTEITEQDDEPKIKSRPFTRRTNNAPSVQPKSISNNIVLACAIDEIKENCSRKTYSTVNSLLENYNKLQKEILENKQKQQLHKNLISRRSQQSNRNSEDQTVNLAAKNMKLLKQNNDLLDKIKDIELQITVLNAKAKDFQEKYEHISNKGFQYFEQQRQASCKIYESTKDCHINIVDSLQQNLIDQGCSKCCMLMKKIKSSLINYKQCLSQQIYVYQKLWESQLKTIKK